ncbi:hypothetical protein D6833_01750, partial [Candidatus Parcubacteria bacterium]
MGNNVKILRERSYSISKVNFIRQALAGYPGGTAIAGEMIQNADDAEATRISFHFRPTSLVVRNDSVFSEKDFESITEIAKGDKAPEQGKIGTWGTGFLSVFHITDAPELLSAGEHIIFDPTQDRLSVYETPIRDFTEFRLPWRFKKTELSRKFEADSWNEEDIKSLKEKLSIDIYRLSLFLRHVRIIEVYDGEEQTEKLIARVERRQIDEKQVVSFFREHWEFVYKRSGLQPRTDIWLYYRKSIPHPAEVRIPVKDNEIMLAIPLKNREWLIQNVPGTLYNFLPTPIKTDLPFQINGAFFPDNNRRGILQSSDTQREKSAWNRHVLNKTGQLFLMALTDIQEQVAAPRRFYEILPISSKQPIAELVKKPFIKHASERKIVWSSQREWVRPQRIFLGRRGSRLPELVADYMPILPTGVPQEFRDFLEKELQVPTLRIKDVLGLLRSHLKPGIPLASAHSMINHREKLEILYGEISGPVSENIPDLVSIPLCLAEDQTLWPFNEIWRANQATRRLLAGMGIRFVDIQMQQKYSSWLVKLVVEFRGAALVEWLAQQEWPNREPMKIQSGIAMGRQLKQIGDRLGVRNWLLPRRAERQEAIDPISLAEAPSFIQDTRHLAEILRFIEQDITNVDTTTLSQLPLARTDDDYLVLPAELYRHDDPEEREFFKKLGLRFVHPDWVKETEIWHVYQRAGVTRLEPRQVIKVLPEAITRWKNLPTEELIENLLTLYQYFIEHVRHLDNRDKDNLRKLPFCVTQQERLAPAKGRDITLHLPSEHNTPIDKRVRRHLDKLALDNLIHSRLIEEEKQFLTEILDVKPLSPDRLIETVIVPHYLDSRLDDAARKDLLHYISKQLQDMPEGQQRALLPKLLDKPLIRCADGEYRPAGSVYFASPVLDKVFANGYHKLHPDYGVPAAKPDDPDQTPYRRS